MADNYELIHGDAGEVLKAYAGKVDMCVTSPTYWNESSMARSGALGREADVRDYAARLVKVFANLKPRMKLSGSLWLVLGDDYRNKAVGVPRMVAKALMEDGWRAKRIYAWEKGDCRVIRTTTLDPRRSRDYVIQFVRGNDYYFAKEPYEGSRGVGAPHNYTGSDTVAFPIQLIKPLIEATCPIGGTVMDPFVGTGTTVMAAVQANRRGVGIDLSDSELDIARVRLGGEYKIMKARDVGTDLQKALRLADRGLHLWGLLLTKAENEDAENPDAGDEGDFLALPEVPAEENLPSKQKVFEALTQVSQMLDQVMKDPELARQLDSAEAERLDAIKDWLGNAGKPVQRPMPMRRPDTVNDGRPLDDDRPLNPAERAEQDGDKMHQPEVRRPDQKQRNRPENRVGNAYNRMLVMKAARDVDLSVKAVIRNPSGHLVLKDAYSDWWDIPGGHVGEGETLDKALAREIKEETDLDLVKARMRGVHALKLGDRIRPVVVYDAVAKGRVRLSEEHTGYAWANKAELERDSFNLGVFKQFIVKTAFASYPGVGAGRAGRGVNAAPIVEVDGVAQEEGSELQVRKQGPPGPPPHPGLQWKEETHRWVSPAHAEVIGRTGTNELHTLHANAARLYHAEQDPGARARHESGFRDVHEELNRRGFERHRDADQALAGYGNSEKLAKQGPPGPPPRPGLVWKPETHRWVHGPDSGGAEGGEYDPSPDDLHGLDPKQLDDRHLDLYRSRARQHEISINDMIAKYGSDESIPVETRRRMFEQTIEAAATRSGMDREWERRRAERHGPSGGPEKLLKGSFDGPESALEAIRREHPDAEVAEQKQDGDIMVECDGGEHESWYVTADGRVYEYWHPESGDVDKGGFHAGASSIGFEPLSN